MRLYETNDGVEAKLGCSVDDGQRLGSF